MPHTPKSHSIARESLCALCFRKMNDLRVISTEQEEHILTLRYSRFSLSDLRLPKVICCSCSRALSANIKDPVNPGRKLPDPKFDNLTSPLMYSTRAQADQPCNCTICLIMRDTIKPGNNIGKLKALPSRFQALLFPDSQDVESVKKSKPEVESRCTACGSVVGKGRTHKCHKSTARENTLGLVRKMSLKSKEKLARDTLLTIFE